MYIHVTFKSSYIKSVLINMYLEASICQLPCDLVKLIPCMFISCKLAKMRRKLYSGRHGAEVMDVVSLDWLQKGINIDQE